MSVEGLITLLSNLCGRSPCHGHGRRLHHTCDCAWQFPPAPAVLFALAAISAYL